ncbi:hypothetical protein ABZY68_25565 [Streptomyces sp. NPDC006482]|uniref:hypothetical protein n=1 Tax=Streptomyces sp. NPDC006482 TaxID=3154306 RepID=UPI0033B9295B
MDPGRAAHEHPVGSGSVITMHPRRTTLLILAALLTSGCVAVPHTPGQGPAARPGELAPAADRPPAPLPTWPEPTQAPPREDLTTTDPHPAPAKTAAPASVMPATERPPVQPDTVQPERRTTPKKHPTTTVKRKTPKPTAQPPTRRTALKTPAAPKKKQQQKPAPRRHQPTTGQTPEMRQLCRQAQQIGAPMGAADLCRSTYGR